MRRPLAEDLLPSNDRWLLSWTDFVTLLLAVFAALYASTSAELSEARARTAQSAPADQAAQPVLSSSVAAAAIAWQLAEALSRLGLGERIQVRQETGGVGIDIDATLLFATGDARLGPQSAATVDALAAALRGGPWRVAVEGHTDSIVIHTPQFASNWELSSARAAVVARRLSELGIDPQRLSATGYADSRPLAPNRTGEGRARNRRVHLRVLVPA